MPPKKMPKKPRVVTQKQKQRQSVNVTINQERPIRRRGPNKPKPSGGGGGQGPGPSQGPSPIQFTPYQMSNPAPGQQPPEPRAQPVINIVNEIPDNFNENVRYYRNPFRLQPFRENMDQNNLRPAEGPLGQSLPSAPPPVLPDIVEEQNFINNASNTPVVAMPISSINPIQGFAVQSPINQLSQEQMDRIKSRLGRSFTPQTPLGENLYEFQQNMGNVQSTLRQSLSLEQPESQSNSPPMQRTSNKGRPFTSLSEDDKQALTLYLDYKDRADKRNYSSTEMYKRGRKLVSQNKSNNPEVMQFIAARNKKA